MHPQHAYTVSYLKLSGTAEKNSLAEAKVFFLFARIFLYLLAFSLNEGTFCHVYLETNTGKFQIWICTV